MIDHAFRVELTALLNKHSKENGSNTPDFLLAEYLSNCLRAFDTAVQAREDWYGRKPGPEMFELRCREEG